MTKPNPTNSMEQGPSWEAISHTASQEITHLLWNSMVHYPLHNSLPLVPILSQVHPVHSFPPCLPKIHSNTVFPSGFPTKILYAFLISPIHPTWPAHLILLDFISLTTFCEAYKLWSSSLCSLLQAPTTNSSLSQNTLLSTLFSDTPNLCSYLSVTH